MQITPKISVIMSVYNTRETWLRKAIESILNQTFNNFEFIIILDCPTDDSYKIIKEYADSDSRILTVENKENVGLTKSLNRALKLAKGKYIARMDSDDISLPERLQKQWDYMEQNSNVVVLGSKICCFGSNNYIEGRSFSNQDRFKVKMLFGNVGVPHPTAFIRRSILDEHNISYTEKIKKGQDYKLWTDLMWFGDILELDEVLLLYRIHENQISYAVRTSQNVIQIDGLRKPKTQTDYANIVALEQVSNLIGDLSECDIAFHSSVANTEIPNQDVDGYSKYLWKLIKKNSEKKIYKQSELLKEIQYLWCYKALRRAKREKKFDMIFHRNFMAVRIPNVWKEICICLSLSKKNKQDWKINKDKYIYYFSK